MKDLPFNWDVFIFDGFALNWDVVRIMLRYDLGNVSSDMFHSIVVSGNYFSRDNVNLHYLFIVGNGPSPGHDRVPWLIHIINYFLFHRHIFDSTFSFY